MVTDKVISTIQFFMLENRQFNVAYSTLISVGNQKNNFYFRIDYSSICLYEYFTGEQNILELVKKMFLTTEVN